MKGKKWKIMPKMNN